MTCMVIKEVDAASSEPNLPSLELVYFLMWLYVKLGAGPSILAVPFSVQARG
jgi:hypothetical protein